MSYQALYRKWRPKTFDEVRGQEAIITTLKNQIKAGRIGHAYLFCGTRGTGKTTVARIFARAVNCGFTDGEGNPCNECAVCRSILNEASMNVTEIDAASNRGIDNIRDLREQVQYPPTEGRYKVFIIDEVHMLSTEAFNALLKTLEEPPEYVIFILATTEVNKIPVTVLSRCQRYDFKRIPAATIAERLTELTEAEQIDIDERAIRYIAKTADGAMRDALSLLDECVAFHPDGRMSYDEVLEILGAADTAAFSGLFGAIVQGRAADAMLTIEDAVLKGRELLQFSSDFLWYMRNLLMIKSAPDASRIVDASKENYELMAKEAAAVSRDALMRYIRIFAELPNRMRYSGQKRVLLELAVIKAMTPQMEDSTDSILERLSVIERKLENGIPAARTVVSPRPVPVRAADGISAEGTVSAPSKDFPGAAAAQKAAEQTTGQDTGPQTGQHAEKQGAEVLTEPRAPQERTAELPKAKYDDLMMLREDWGRILTGLSPMNRSFLRDTILEPGEGNVMMVVFSDPGTFSLTHSVESAVLEAQERINEKYGREFVLKARLRDRQEISPVKYITKEELEDIIKMPVEIEE